jgi:hypothetical protein
MRPSVSRSFGYLMLVLAPFLLGAEEGGCGRGEDSKNVNQSRIFTQYWLLYDANTDTTYARATFRLSNALGTVLELKQPAVVTFNDKPMNFVGGWGWHEAQLPGKVTGLFKYTNVEAKAQSVEANSFPDIAPPAGLMSTAPGKAFTVAFVGAPVASGERVEVVLSGPNKLDFSLILQTTVGAKEVVVSADQTARFNAKGWLGLRRYSEKPVSGTEVGGSLTQSVYAKDVPLEWKAP